MGKLCQVFLCNGTRHVWGPSLVPRAGWVGQFWVFYKHDLSSVHNDFQLIILRTTITYTTHTIGSNSTVSSATPGQSVVGLITFAALYCGILVLCALLFAMTWCWCWCLCSHLKDIKLDTSKDTRGDVRECPGEDMGEDNTKKDESDDNTKQDMKEDMRQDNFINVLYVFLKKAIKGM